MRDPQAQDAHAAALETLEEAAKYVDRFSNLNAMAALSLVRSRLVVLEQERDGLREALEVLAVGAASESVRQLARSTLRNADAAVSVADIPQEDTP